MSITLAIESAIAGGSVSILRGGTEIASWTGRSGISRAEDLLPTIDRLLREQGIDRTEINFVAVSAGPGSFTGIRIGIATALGLKAGLGLPMASQSALSAIALAHVGNSVIVAVPTGRNAVAVQTFDHSGAPVTGPESIPIERLDEVRSAEPGATFLVHDALFEAVKSMNTINVGANIARLVGLACLQDAGVVAPPIFLSKSF